MRASRLSLAIAVLCIIALSSPAVSAEGFWSSFTGFFRAEESPTAQRQSPVIPLPETTGDGTIDTGTAAPGICSTCDAVICSYPSGGLFVCPGTLNMCRARFGDTCTQPGCYKTACASTVHRCVKNDREIQCKGTLEECTRMYGRCACGTEQPSCTFEGAQYADGETAPLGCNTCTCMRGQMVCTTKACPVVCDVDGTAYKPGDHFVLRGVNCQCTRTGSISCGSTCPIMECAAPPEGCHYEPGTDSNGCQTCGQLMCNTEPIICPMTVCAAPPPNCTYLPAKDSNGCPTCGELSCPTQQCAHVECPTPPTGCYYKPEINSNGCRTCGTVICENKSCLYNGRTYAAGTYFNSTDGCNSCACSEGGIIACTQRACGVTCTYGDRQYTPGERLTLEGKTCECTQTGTFACSTPPGTATCTYANTRYSAGQKFPASDGCNSCYCGDNGRVICTTQTCAPASDYCNDASDCVRQASCCDCGTGTWVNKAAYKPVTCEQMCMCPAFIPSLPACENHHCVAADLTTDTLR